jgi:hypothetical protein
VQAEQLSGALEKRIATLEAAVASGFAATGRDHAAAAESVQTLRDGIWKGFDDSANHRRELNTKAASDLASLTGSVEGVRAEIRAVSASLDSSVGSADTPVRKAADTTLALLPSVSEAVRSIVSATGALQGAVADAGSRSQPGVEAAVQAAHADIKAAVTEARSTLSSYVMGVQVR